MVAIKLKNIIDKRKISLDVIDKINRSSYLKKEIAGAYISENRLLKAEEVIFEKIQDEIKEKAVLDIGVGGGRTSNYLKELTNDYIGIDYSRVMVEGCKKQYPAINIICCDARNMSIFEDGQFDLVLFSFNGIDTVTHADRLAILREIFRVLKINGNFVFSSHNRDYAGFNKFKSYKLSLNPFKFYEILGGLYNHFKNRRFEIHTKEYSIINEPTHNYSFMAYYIGVIEQVEQMRNIGFRGPFDAYDLNGNKIPINIKHTSSCWIYYCLKK
jgi:SAM-dependent methyltransferase